MSDKKSFRFFIPVFKANWEAWWRAWALKKIKVWIVNTLTAKRGLFLVSGESKRKKAPQETAFSQPEGAVVFSLSYLLYLSQTCVYSSRLPSFTLRGFSQKVLTQKAPSRWEKTVEDCLLSPRRGLSQKVLTQKSPLGMGEGSLLIWDARPKIVLVECTSVIYKAWIWRLPSLTPKGFKSEGPNAKKPPRNGRRQSLDLRRKT